jgi:hypothetical protein
MDRTPVASSTIVSIGYDPESLTLEVEFKNGTVCQYTDVPPGEYEAFMYAESKGSYLHSNIKNYPCSRL